MQGINCPLHLFRCNALLRVLVRVYSGPGVGIPRKRIPRTVYMCRRSAIRYCVHRVSERSQGTIIDRSGVLWLTTLVFLRIMLLRFDPILSLPLCFAR